MAGARNDYKTYYSSRKWSFLFSIFVVIFFLNFISVGKIRISRYFAVRPITRRVVTFRDKPLFFLKKIFAEDNLKFSAPEPASEKLRNEVEFIYIHTHTPR